jgi:RNA polymerase sigma-70 factor (ECF subfamily)
MADAANSSRAETDADLIARIASDRDAAAFAALYDRLGPRVFGLLLKVLRNRADAEDVLQEAFLQVWNQAARFDPARSVPLGWVLMIARSRATDRLRKKSAVTAESPPEVPHTPDPAAGLQATETAGRMGAALESLPADQAGPIRLAFFDGLTHEGIAVKLGIPLGTVKTRIRLGMARLRERFPDHAPSNGQAGQPTAPSTGKPA